MKRLFSLSIITCTTLLTTTLTNAAPVQLSGFIMLGLQQNYIGGGFGSTFSSGPCRPEKINITVDDNLDTFATITSQITQAINLIPMTQFQQYYLGGGTRQLLKAEALTNNLANNTIGYVDFTDPNLSTQTLTTANVQYSTGTGIKSIDIWGAAI